MAEAPEPCGLAIALQPLRERPRHAGVHHPLHEALQPPSLVHKVEPAAIPFGQVSVHRPSRNPLHPSTLVAGLREATPTACELPVGQARTELPQAAHLRLSIGELLEPRHEATRKLPVEPAAQHLLQLAPLLDKGQPAHQCLHLASAAHALAEGGQAAAFVAELEPFVVCAMELAVAHAPSVLGHFVHPRAPPLHHLLPCAHRRMQDAPPHVEDDSIDGHGFGLSRLSLVGA